MSTTERPASGAGHARAPRELPTGTVTFLFTDIEGSTRAWIRNPAAMGASLARHDELIERVVAEHGGQVVRPRGEGDSRFAVFARASDGVAAACAIQIALVQEPWPLPEPLRVRVALHTGEADLRTGDYYGPAVNHCARLRTAAHAGQVLASAVTADLVREALPAELKLRDLGEHQLKDLERPERVWQLVHPQLPSVFPPLHSLSRLRHNLPTQTTPFIGRQHTLEAVKGLFGEGVRLLSLTGPGGIGKTRLALQVATELLEKFPDGVFYVALAPIADASLVCATIARALGIRETGGRPIVEELTEYLQTKELLLVLDNFEHLMASAQLVGEVLDTCPRLSVLVTSRTVLHLAREQVFEVPAMRGSDPHLVADLAATLEYDAVKLFVERARAVQTDFALTAQNVRAVVEICEHLEGLPLAIELAAARVRLMGPEALLGRLSSRLGLLTTGPRDVPARHQTLRGAIAWSYELLTSTEQWLFECLAVFSGGFSLEAAEAVGNADAGIAVLDGLTALVDQSLIQIKRLDAEPAEPRFELLETIREYALERLAASGHELGTRDRHSAYFLALAESADAQLTGPHQVEWLARLEHEHDNFRAALKSYDEYQDSANALRMTGALAGFWLRRGYVREGREWLERALAAGADATPALRMVALRGAGSLAAFDHDFQSARAVQSEALALARMLGHQHSIAVCLNSLGYTELSEGNYTAARVLLTDGLDLFRTLEDAVGIALCLFALANLAATTGNNSQAAALFTESLAQVREVGDTWRIASCLHGLGHLAWREGNTQRATTLLRESLTGSAELRDQRGIAVSLESMALVLSARRPAAAARLFGAASALRSETGARRRGWLDGDYDRGLKRVRSALGEAVFNAAWAAGRGRSAEESIGEALAGTSAADERSASPLTRREGEVTRLVTRGLTNRQIGEALVITEGTAALHVKNALSKLGFKSRAQLAAWASQQPQLSIR